MEEKNVIPRLGFPFQSAFPFLENTIKNPIAHIYPISYKALIRVEYCILTVMPKHTLHPGFSIIHSFLPNFYSNRGQRKKPPSYILKGFSVEMMPQVIFVASDTFKSLKV